MRVASATLQTAVIPLEPALPLVSSSLPRDNGWAVLSIPIRGLAPDGVCRAASVAGSAVGSYPTVSPLPDRASSVRRSVLCCTFLEVTFTGGYPASCPVEPGLSSKSFDFAIACFTMNHNTMTRSEMFSQSRLSDPVRREFQIRTTAGYAANSNDKPRREVFPVSSNIRCFSFRFALASSCRARSLDTPSLRPISANETSSSVSAIRRCSTM